MLPVVLVTEPWGKGEACKARPESFFQRCYNFFPIRLKSTFSTEKYHHLEKHSCWHTLVAVREMKAMKKKFKWGSSWRSYIQEETKCQKMQFSWKKYILQRNIWNTERISIKRKDPILCKWYNMAMLSTNCWALKMAALDKEVIENGKRLLGNKA